MNLPGTEAPDRSRRSSPPIRASRAGTARPRWPSPGRTLALLGLLLLGGTGSPARAQSPDDRFVQAYSLLEEADKLNASRQTAAAVTKYLEAQVVLNNLQQTYPDWNPRLIGFRLQYISGKLEPLTRKAPPAAKGHAPAAPSFNDQLRGWQEDIDRLSSQNTLLQAKLREALSVQPAAVDPRELAKAEARIKELQKERDLLAVTLEQAGAKPGAADASNAKQSVVTQSAVASVLQKQNEELLRQIGDLTARLKGASGASGGTPGADTLALRETIAALEASNKVLKEEQLQMENRLKEFVRQQGTAVSQRQTELEQQLAEARAAAKSAQKERDDLIQKLSEVTRQLNQADPRASTANVQELERRMEAIRAKLQIFEAKNLPYTAEELALFKQAPLKVAAAAAPSSNSPPARAAEETAGAGTGTATLLADASRDIDNGRYAEAEQKFREALRQDPQNGFLMSKLGAVLMDQDRVGDAESVLKQALQINPQDPVALYLLGGLKLREEKYDDALEALGLSAKIDPDRAQTQYFLGQALIQKGSRGPAETALRRALQLKPGWGDAHYLLAVLYATQEPNFRELAQYHYNKAIAGGVGRNYQLEKVFQKGAGH